MNYIRSIQVAQYLAMFGSLVHADSTVCSATSSVLGAVAFRLKSRVEQVDSKVELLVEADLGEEGISAIANTLD